MTDCGLGLAAWVRRTVLPAVTTTTAAMMAGICQEGEVLDSSERGERRGDSNIPGMWAPFIPGMSGSGSGSNTPGVWAPSTPGVVEFDARPSFLK